MYCEKCGKYSGRYNLCKECYYAENEKTEELSNTLPYETTELKCPICGEPTSVYYGNARKDGLCSKHGKSANSGEIVQCPDCGKWNEKGAGCECRSFARKSKDKEIIEENKSTDELTCIICGEPSNGKHFCIKCWKKYKERTITIEVKNCTEFEITDAYGNKNTKTANGLYVRSLSEKIIYDELFRRNIKCEYERTVTYKDENGNIKELHPDFYLSDYKLYIEHWGCLDSRNKEYEETKRYKEKIYEAKGYKFAATTSKDIKDIQAAIERLLLENNIET